MGPKAGGKGRVRIFGQFKGSRGRPEDGVGKIGLYLVKQLMSF